LIENVTAKSGQPVIRWRGRLLASRLDPVHEAAEWFQKRAAFADKVKTVIILGAGSGYHIRECARRTGARILVIDPRAELIEAVKAVLDEVAARVQFVNVQAARELRSHSDIRAAVAASFIVLEHPASISLEKEFFRECSAQLIGRDWGNLNWQWSLKGFPAFDSRPRIDGGDAALSIYDLEQTELVQDSEERERMLLKALRELVK
jgi:hypothetical protein